MVLSLLTGVDNFVKTTLTIPISYKYFFKIYVVVFKAISNTVIKISVIFTRFSIKPGVVKRTTLHIEPIVLRRLTFVKVESG